MSHHMKDNIISDDITEVELVARGTMWGLHFRREKQPAGQLPKYSMEKIGIKALLK